MMEHISEQLPKTFNVAAYLLNGNLEQGNSQKVAFFSRQDNYTYEQLNHCVQQAARLLASLGLERENRLAILLPDSPESVFAFWGAIWLGAIPVPINTSSSIEHVQYILRDSRAKILLSDRDWQDKLVPIESPFLQQVLLTDGDDSWLSLLSQQPQEPLPCAETARDEPAFWLYTSGSTGMPKGVVHLHQSMVVCAECYAKATLDLKPDDIIYSAANIPFAYGLGNTLYMPLAVGASAVLSDASNIFDIIADINHYRPTVLFGIPSLYANLLAVSDIESLDVNLLRLCISAAEQLPESIWQQWRETYGREIYEGIGTTEFLHIFLANRPGECKPGTSGRPVAGYDVQVVDRDGQPCAPGEIGDLVVSGESLMLGYWNRLTDTRQALWGNTMHTGDKYLRDEEGYFKFMGRKDDLFKVNGQWISPLEIEDILHQHPQILEVAVLPESDEGEKLTQVVAYVSLKSGQEPTSELGTEIYQFAKQRLTHFKAPKALRFVKQLPRTATGKIHRKSVADSQKMALNQS
jgi:benzoate-CoA ligase family protein